MEILNEYLEFLFLSLKTDVSYFNNWWMLFVLPAMGWFIVLMFKYVLLLMPVWITIGIIGRMSNIIIGGNGNGSSTKQE